MDPVDTLHAVSRQEALLGQYEQLLQALVENSTQMAMAMADLMQQVMLLVGPALQPAGPTASATGTSPWIPSMHICNPELFHGDLNKCQGFLQCQLVFRQKALFFTNDFPKVSNLVGLLRGKALA